MRILITLLLAVMLTGCFNTSEEIKITSIAQLDHRDLRFRVFSEVPAKVTADGTVLVITLFQQEQAVRQERLPLRLLGVEYVEKSNGMFASNIEYNGQLMSIDESGEEMFDELKQQYPAASFSFDIEPRFFDVPKKDSMYFTASVKLSRLGDFEPLIGNRVIDVPRD